jgi:hypothetical protein
MNNQIIKVTKKNVDVLYNDPNGNLYYINDNEPWIVDGFSLKEVKQAMKNGVDFIFKS